MSAPTLNSSAINVGGSLSSGTVRSVSPQTVSINDIIVVVAIGEARDGASVYGNASFTDTDSLTWHKRQQIKWESTDTSSYNTLDVWWAVATTAHTGFAYTVNAKWDQNLDGAMVGVYVVTGANTTNPWERSVAFPYAVTDGTADDSQTVTSTDANLFAISVYGAADQSFSAYTEPTISGGSMANAQVSQSGASSDYRSMSLDYESGTALTATAISYNNPAISHVFYIDALTSDTPYPSTVYYIGQGGAHDASFAAGITSATVQLYSETGNLCAVCVATGGFWNAGTVTGVTDSTGQTWSKYTSDVPGSNAKMDLEIWYCIANTTITNSTVTVALTTTGAASLWAVSVNTPNSGAPFDPNSSLPAFTDAAGSGNPSVSVSTNPAVSTIFAMFASWGSPTGTNGTVSSPLTYVGDQTEQETDGEEIAADFAFYQTTSAETGLSIDFGLSGGSSGDRYLIAFAVDQFTPPVLDLAVGSYTITGAAAALREAHKLGAAAGSYAYTGDAASLGPHGFSLDAAAGSYTITGDAALLYRNVTGTWASTDTKDTFSGAAFDVPLNLDGYAEGGGHDSSFGVGITSASVTLSTTFHDDVIVLLIESGGFFNSAAVTSITDTAGLVWKRRQQRNITGTPLGVSESNAASVEVWWAHAPSPLSGDVITVNTGTTGAISIIAFGVSGANYTTPWDTNQRAGWATDSYGFGNPTGTLSTDATNSFVFAFYASNSVPEGGAMNSGSPFTYVTTKSESETDGETEYISFAAVLSEAAQNAYGPIYFEQSGGTNNRMLMIDTIVGRLESGTADAVLWFLDGGTATNTAIIDTTDPLSLVTAVEQSMTVYNAETVVVVVAVILSASGLGEVQSVEDVSGHSPWQRRSRKTNSTGSIAIEVWWAPWITGENENGITVTPMNVENNDSISMLVFAVGGATGFLTGNYWDSNASLPATGTSESGGVPAVTDMTSDVGNALALAFTTNITVPFNNGQNSVLPFVGETPDVIGPFNSATYPPPLWLVGAAPPVNVAVQFSFTHAALSDETAQFFSSPEPQYSVTIGDVLTVGPPQPPVGVWGSTEAQDKFTHAGDYTSIGIASPGGWVGVLPTHGTWASTEATDKTTGAPAQAPYDSIGWLGWVPAHCTWASTERKDIWSAGGWVIGHPVTGRWTSAESRDRMAFSEYTLGAVSGTWGSTDTPDRMASVGFEVPTTVPVVPRNRKRMLIIS